MDKEITDYLKKEFKREDFKIVDLFHQQLDELRKKFLNGYSETIKKKLSDDIKNFDIKEISNFASIYHLPKTYTEFYNFEIIINQEWTLRHFYWMDTK